MGALASPGEFAVEGGDGSAAPDFLFVDGGEVEGIERW